jgi:hypothetical protein
VRKFRIMKAAKNVRGKRWMRLLVGVGISLSLHTVVGLMARLGPIRAAVESLRADVDDDAALAWFGVPPSSEMPSFDASNQQSDTVVRGKSTRQTRRPTPSPQALIEHERNDMKVRVEEETGRQEALSEAQDASGLLRRRQVGPSSTIARVLNPTSSPFSASPEHIFKVAEGDERTQDILRLQIDRPAGGHEVLEKLMPFAKVAGLRWREHIQGMREPTLVHGASAAAELLLRGPEGWREYHVESSRQLSSTAKAKVVDDDGLEGKRRDCLVEVHLKPNGEPKVGLLQSSGSKELDQAAMRIAEEEAIYSRDGLRHLGVASIRYRFGIEERVNLPLCRSEQEGNEADPAKPRFDQAQTVSCGLNVDSARFSAPFSTTREASVKIVDFQLSPEATGPDESTTAPGNPPTK